MAVKFNLNSEEPIINRLHGDKVIWIICFILSLISIALIYSASSSLAFKENVTNFSYLMNQCKFVLLGLVTVYICYKIPLGVYRFATYFIFGISLLLLMLTLVPGIGKEINGARRWIMIGPIQFQPAELVKITLILYLARALEMWELKNFKDFIIKILAPIGVVCVLILVGSVSTSLIVGALSFLILWMAGVKVSYLLKSIGLAACFFVFLILLNSGVKLIDKDIDLFPRFSTAVSRLEKFFVKEEIDANLSAEEIQKKKDETFQADMARIAISSVGVLGKGPGKSTQRYVLPHPYSDFIYTIIIEEYGLLGGVFVLMLYLWFLYRCVIMVKHCTKKFTAITVGGLGLMISIQAGLHILVNVGILPVTGHTLPLVSLGGTSLLIFSCAFGIVLSVSRTIDIDNTKKAEQKRLEKEEAERLAAERREAEATAAELKEGENVTAAGNGEEMLHDIIDEHTGEFK